MLVLFERSVSDFVTVIHSHLLLFVLVRHLSSLSLVLFTMPASARARSRSLRRLDREEASVVLRCAPADGGFWLPMLDVGLFGVQPSFSDLRLLRSRRMAARDGDLHRFFYTITDAEAEVRRIEAAAALELADWDIEPVLRLPLQPGRRIGIRSYISPIHP